MPKQLARWGGTMDEWRRHVEDTRDFITRRQHFLLTTGMRECYGLSNPAHLTVQISPPEAGARVQVNTVRPPFPHTGKYYGSMPVTLEADDDCCWTFSHWESVTNQPIANPNNPTFEYSLSGDDTVIAHFVQQAPELVINEINYHVSIAVNPDGSVTPNNEFVELYNRGASTVNLDGVHFSDGYPAMSLRPGLSFQRAAIWRWPKTPTRLRRSTASSPTTNTPVGPRTAVNASPSRGRKGPRSMRSPTTTGVGGMTAPMASAARSSSSIRPSTMRSALRGARRRPFRAPRATRTRWSPCRLGRRSPNNPVADDYSIAAKRTLPMTAR